MINHTLYILLGDSLDRSLVESRCRSTPARQYNREHCAKCLVCDGMASVDGAMWLNIMLFGVGSQGCYHTDHAWAPLEESRNVTARVRRFLSHALEESPRHQQVVVQVHSGLWDVFATKANSLCSTPMPAGMKSFMGPFYNGEWAINVRERLISPVREIISERRPDAKLIWRSMPFLCDHAAFGNDAKLTHFVACARLQPPRSPSPPHPSVYRIETPDTCRRPISLGAHRWRLPPPKAFSSHALSTCRYGIGAGSRARR
jgi:hypothetical protein